MKPFAFFPLLLLLVPLYAVEGGASDPEMESFRTEVEAVLGSRQVPVPDIAGSPFVRPLREPEEGETVLKEEPPAPVEVPLLRRTPKLQAVMGGSALLDDRWFKAGEEVEGYRIVRVGNEEVVLRDDQGEKTLRIGGSTDAIRLERVGR